MFRRQLVLGSVRRLGGFVLAASWLLVLSSAAYAFDVIRITNNDNTHEYNPAVSGTNVVWEDGYSSGTEIYLMRGAPPPVLPAPSTPAAALLTGLLIGTAWWLIRRRRVASV